LALTLCKHAALRKVYWTEAVQTVPVIAEAPKCPGVSCVRIVRVDPAFGYK
jgi:hypothetical protein